MRLPRPRPRFPLGPPSWPGGVARPPAERRTGVDYDTAWARRYPARLARALVLDGLTRPLVHAVAAPDVDGLDRLEALRPPAIFAPNHASHVDTPLVLACLPERFRHRTVVGAAADHFFDRRWKGGLWALAINAIPVERARVSPQSTRLATGLLRDGWSLVLFPEGGRSPDGWGRAHRAGAAYLALRTGAPVVPVHLHGTRRILAKGGRGLRPARTEVTFGRPMRPDEGEGAQAFAARVEAAVAVLADERASGFWLARRRAESGLTPALTGPPGSGWRRAWALARGGRRAGGGPAWPPGSAPGR